MPKVPTIKFQKASKLLIECDGQKTNVAIASELGIDRRTVQRARKALEMRGKISLQVSQRYSQRKSKPVDEVPLGNRPAFEQLDAWYRRFYPKRGISILDS